VLAGNAFDEITLRLHRLYTLPILLSGGQVFSDTGSEAEIARRVLRSLSVPGEMIYVETHSRTTGQNARYSAEILRREGFAHPILVTSAFHLPRAVLNFEKEGVAVTPYPTDFWVSGNPQLYALKFAPNASAVSPSAPTAPPRQNPASPWGATALPTVKRVRRVLTRWVRRVRLPMLPCGRRPQVRFPSVMRRPKPRGKSPTLPQARKTAMQ